MLKRAIKWTLLVAIALLVVSVSIPSYQKAQHRKIESLLKSNLFTLRMMIDQYKFDHKRAPRALQELVSGRYLSAIPIDPIAGKAQWVVVMEDANAPQRGIRDVHSGSEMLSLDGRPYSEW